MMEIKHTVEILTKDIQDIEKLVRNLNNSPIPPRIELDLALSKLRHVYELLSMIRTDADQDNATKEEPVIEVPVEKEPIVQAPVAEEPVAQAPLREEPKAEEQDVHATLSEEPKAEEPIAKEQDIQAPAAEEPAAQAQKAEEQVIQAPAAEEPAAKEPVMEKSPKAEPVQTEIPLKEPAILAEKFANDPSINENIASNKPRTDLSSKITGQPIDNIGRNVGINDRFLIIRELFDGDNDSYNHLISQLDSSSGSEEALAILETKFPEQMDHEGYLLLSQLARRKFISG